jgi:hypothetical protein
MFIQHFSFCECNLIGVNETNIHSYSIYPNPSQNQIRVELNESAASTTFELYDCLGKKQFSQALLNSQTDIYLHQPAGIYLYIIRNEQSGLISTGKLIIK